jgi:hypothetical protein
MKFVERTTPCVAIVIDLNGVDYVLSSADLGIVVSEDGILGKRVGLHGQW